MRSMNRRATALGLLAATFCLAHAAPGHSQTWPTHAVTIVVPFTAGTTSDVIARSLAQELSAKFGQPFIVENKGGAGGNIGAASVARAAPDGYTILFATTSQAATNKLMYKHMEYDPQRDFAPVVLVGKAPVIVTARPDAPYNSLAEFITYAKANPNKVTGGFPGNGTLGHITGELLASKAGIEFGKTQYRGAAAILADLLGGHIDIGMDSMAPYVSNVREGKIKALAIASSKRWSVLPDVPTVAESGLPGFEASVWYAMLVPAKVPSDIVDRLNAATNVWLKDPKTQESLVSFGSEPAGGSPADLAAFTQSEIDKWSPIIKDANITF
ncbi:Bug family tripartite tricarboxylate transporter substrate binding protein [Rhodopseudomonas sp. RCAM05734]|uniref:Bug family tripartite tricarboxylate transporter substrate binding protein n=1 Tax=Rhodopseudomonas sp. RCAM05734 TaxID=3457549 RepID=UPI00404494E9